jgi:hypothetical protein
MSTESNWIDGVIAECEHVETPRSWLYWSLCCAISAAAGNNYYLRTLRGAVIIKPNIYVMLLGPSGLGKGFPTKLSKRLVKISNTTRVIGGRSSIQAIVKELSTVSTREGAPPINDSRGYLVNGELSTAVIQDPNALTLLTDLYDGEDNKDWANLLKGDGKEQLKDPYLTALFGSSPAHFHDSVPQVNVEGGYIGRNLLVTEESRYKDSDLLDDESEEEALQEFPYETFAQHLVVIGKNKGRMIPSPEAKKLYNEWRRKWREHEKPDVTGFVTRVPIHALKLSMLLALAEKDLSNLIITEKHIQESIDKVTPLAYSSKSMSDGKGENPLAAQTKFVIELLIKAPDHKMMKRSILATGYGRFDTKMLDSILDTLEEIKWISKNRIIAGKNTDVEIKLAGEPLKQYVEFMNAKGKRTAVG